MSAIRRLLVANRGEVVRRVQRTCRAMGIGTVAVFSDADRDAAFVQEADFAVALGGESAAESYLRIDAILDAARRSGADAVHPGYGFLSESADFAEAVTAAGLTFVGPTAASMRALGSKVEAKRAAAQAGVPVLPWAVMGEDAAHVGIPLLIKAAAGGGGRGMRVVHDRAAMPEALAAASAEAQSSFGDGTVFVESYRAGARHVEVQVFGDMAGNVITLFERECSVQRRWQKVIEEAPSPSIDEDLRQRLCAAAIAVARTAGYVGAGTVEFLVDGREFFFLEMNTRLQVEHPVTEAVTGLDLVRLQLRVASGEALPLTPPTLHGHAIEARLYAEDPSRSDLPAAGVIHRFHVPQGDGVRVDTGALDGTVVSPHYDPLLAKLIVHAPTRAEACALLSDALVRTQVHGVATNRDLLVRVLRHPAFLAGEADTGFLEQHPELRDPLADPPEQRLHAAAAVVAATAARRSRARVLGFAPVGWRNNASAPQRMELQTRDGVLQVDCTWSRDGVRVVVAGEPAGDVRLAGATASRVMLQAGGVQRGFDVSAVGDELFVDGPLGSSTFTVRPRFPDAQATAVAGSLLAPMPGRVARVLVAEGDAVEAGALVLVLEAMKMEHRIVAPAAGRVSRLPVAAGAQVTAGSVLAVVDPR